MISEVESSPVVFRATWLRMRRSVGSHLVEFDEYSPLHNYPHPRSGRCQTQLV